MTILLTGATGYIGKRLLPVLVDNGHRVICLVRDAQRMEVPESIRPSVELVEADLLNRDSLDKIPQGIDIAYYLVHSMSSGKDYLDLEQKSAEHFKDRMDALGVEQVIYLSGMVNEEELSTHLKSRKNVEGILGKGNFALTTLRAGIVIGSGSASFEIIRDLVEKLPFMITPKWLLTRCQPIGISDVLEALSKAAGESRCYDASFDLAGPDILTYKQMLLTFADVRGLRRSIVTVPVMTPKLSSYWLYFVTSVSFPLASALVDSMKVEVVARDQRINEILGLNPLSYREALERAFKMIQENQIVSSWKDSLVSGRLNIRMNDFLQVPEYGCFKDRRVTRYRDKDITINRIWSIGGNTGWYHANWLWQIRGFLDKLIGGVGLRRGRTHKNHIEVGDAIDFWRVLYADKQEGRMLLFAEMKLPGEAWLEFKIDGENIVQTATFRPRGIAGRAYWFAVLPLHGIVFKGMINKLAD